MSDAILVINAGSSSVKFSLFEGHGGRDPRSLFATVNSMASDIACISSLRTTLQNLWPIGI